MVLLATDGQTDPVYIQRDTFAFEANTEADKNFLWPTCIGATEQIGNRKPIYNQT